MTDAPTPREVLEAALHKAAVMRTETVTLQAPQARDILATLTRREPLDVERLNAACLVVFPWWADDVTPYRWADRIAAEYSRLEAADKT